MTETALRGATKTPLWYRIAAEMQLEDPSVTHDAIATRVGRHRVTVTRGMQTPEYDAVMTELMNGYPGAQIDAIAMRALRVHVAKNPQVALRWLELRRRFKPERIEVTGADGSPLLPDDLRAEIRLMAKRIAGGTVVEPAAEAQAKPEGPELGPEGSAEAGPK